MALLNHEQRHFDITEWYARLLHQKLQEAQLNSRNFRQMVQKIFARHHKALAAIQQQYDRETHHGIKAAEQAEWDRKIDRALNRTKHLEDRPIVHVLR